MQQSILIVGGTSGLGRRLSELYAAEGAKVGIIGRRQHLLDEIRNQYPVQTFALDISSKNAYEEVLSIINSLGRIDTLIIAASVVEFNPLLQFSIEEKTIAVNVVGFAAVMNAGYHYFLKKGDGHIVTITSTAAARGNKTAPAYNSSKAFQSSYTEGVRLKLLQENKNIYVTEIVPGYMNTRMAQGDRLFWVTPLQKAAKQTKKAIALKKRRAYISRRWLLIYKLYKYIPSFLYILLINSQIKLSQKS